MDDQAEGNNVLEKAPKQSPPLKEEDGDAPALLAVTPTRMTRALSAGSQANDIWEVDDDPRQLVEGQSELVFGIAANPDPDTASRTRPAAQMVRCTFGMPTHGSASSRSKSSVDQSRSLLAVKRRSSQSEGSPV